MGALATLRTELRARLGLSGTADSYGPSQATLNSILARSQEWLYWAYTWEHLRQTYSLSSQIGVSSYQYPGSPPLERRKGIDVTVVTSTGASTLLREGIPPQLKHASTPNQMPVRWWDAGGNFNVWPAPDAVYTFTFDGYQQLGPFAADTDTSTIDDTAIMELSIALGKLHYGQVDGQTFLALLNALVAKLDARNGTSIQIQPRGAP